jgi:hypothetical protein
LFVAAVQLKAARLLATTADVRRTSSAALHQNRFMQTTDLCAKACLQFMRPEQAAAHSCMEAAASCAASLALHAVLALPFMYQRLPALQPHLFGSRSAVQAAQVPMTNRV